MLRAVSVLLVATLAAVFFAGCGGERPSSQASKSAPTVQATLMTVERVPVDNLSEAMGTVRPKTASTIQSLATGHVVAVHVREGDRVEQGQLLVEVDDREAQAMVARAENSLREAESARREVERSRQAAEHARQAAEAGSALAESNHQRYKGLVETGVVSRQLYDEASAKWKGAAAEVAQAGEMVLAAEARRGETDARIEQARAEVEQARTVLSHTRVTAPFAGVVTRKTVDIGDLAGPGMPLLELEDPGLYRLEANLDEKHAQSIRLGDAVTVRLDAVAAEMAGVVAEILPSNDPASRTFLVKIDLPREDSVRSGMFGRARFKGPQVTTLAVPMASVIERGQLASVYVAGEDGRLRLRLVTLGKRFGDMVEVLSGLDEGERVVASDVTNVVDGARLAS